MGYFFHFSSCPTHWIFYVLAYLNFIFEFQSSFSTAQNGPKWPTLPKRRKYQFHLNYLEHSICISLQYWFNCVNCVNYNNNNHGNNYQWWCNPLECWKLLSNCFNAFVQLLCTLLLKTGSDKIIYWHGWSRSLLKSFDLSWRRVSSKQMERMLCSRYSFLMGFIMLKNSKGLWFYSQKFSKQPLTVFCNDKTQKERVSTMLINHLIRPCL